jgi:hypothetical protein
VLFCTDRFQSNVDDILSGSSDHIVPSCYNNPVSEAHLSTSGFLSESLCIRDSRQSSFDDVAFTMAVRNDIITDICTS